MSKSRLMTAEQHKINEAFENLLDTNLSNESRRQIAAEYCKDILAQVEKIYDESLDVHVDWRSATMDEGLDTLHKFHSEKYSWLSRKARLKINHSFVMTWK